MIDTPTDQRSITTILADVVEFTGMALFRITSGFDPRLNTLQGELEAAADRMVEGGNPLADRDEPRLMFEALFHVQHARTVQDSDAEDRWAVIAFALLLQVRRLAWLALDLRGKGIKL